MINQEKSNTTYDFPEPYSVTILEECSKLQIKKSRDYQNPSSTVRQIDYYPFGLQSIFQEVNTKLLRIKSLIESGVEPENEALRDSFVDLINYASFGVTFIDGKLPGQNDEK